jgi:hypothetical protein
VSLVVFHDKIWSGQWLVICDTCQPDGGSMLPFGNSEGDARHWAEQHQGAHDASCTSCHATAGHPHTEYCQATVRRAAFDEAIAKVGSAPDDFPVEVSVIKALLTEVRDGA